MTFFVLSVKHQVCIDHDTQRDVLSRKVGSSQFCVSIMCFLPRMLILLDTYSHGSLTRMERAWISWPRAGATFGHTEAIVGSTRAQLACVACGKAIASVQVPSTKFVDAQFRR